jgi:DNA-binding NarL/FixJ family response regulator
VGCYDQTPRILFFLLALRMLIADDHSVVRAGLRSLLESYPGWEVCAEAADKAAKHKPHVAVLDIGMPLLHGADATRRIRKSSPDTEVLILTMHESEDLVQQVIEAGARAYILKDEADRILIAAVTSRASLHASLPPPILLTLPSRPNPLTPASLPANAKSCNCVNTAEAHRANIMLKLGFHSITELVVYAVRNKII